MKLNITTQGKYYVKFYILQQLNTILEVSFEMFLNILGNQVKTEILKWLTVILTWSSFRHNQKCFIQ